MKLKQYLKVYLLYLLFPLTIFYPLLFGKAYVATDLLFKANPWKNSNVIVNNGILADSPSIYYPDHLYFWKNIKSFSFPFFKPHIFGGTSFDFFGIGKLIANIPGFMLNTSSSFGWVALFDLSLCGLFMYLLLRKLNVNYWVAFFGGLAYMFNGPRLVWLHYPSHIGTELWFPLMAYSLLLLVEYRKIQYVIFSGFIYGFLISGGSLQNSLYFSIFLLFFSIFLIIYKKMNLRFIFHFVGVALIGLLIAGPTIFNMADSMGDSLRREQEGLRSISSQYTSFENIVKYNINFLIPDFWGDGVKVPYGGPANFIEFNHYFSMLLIVLLLVGFWVSRKNMFFWLFSGVGILFYLVMTGFPFITNLFEAIPFLGFGAIGRIIVLVHFCFIIAAFIALDHLLTSDFKKSTMMFIYILGIIMLLLGSACILGADNELSTSSILMFFCLTFLSILGLLFINVIKDYRYALTLMILVFMVGNLFYYKGFNTFVDKNQVFPQTASIEFLQKNTQSDLSRVHIIRNDYWSLFPPNTLQVYDILETGGYSTLLNSKYKDLFSESFKEVFLTTNGVMGTANSDHSLLNMLSVKYIVSKAEQNIDNFQLVYDNEVKIYENKDYLPHFYFSKQLMYVESEDQIKQDIVMNRLDYANITLHNNKEVNEKGKLGQNSVEKVSSITNGYVVDVTADYKGYLVLSETYSTYLRAWADGHELKTFPGNYIQTVVEVPQGSQQLVIKYRPPLLVNLFIVALCLSLLVLVISLFKLKKGRDNVLIINISLSSICIFYFSLAIFTS